MTAALTIAAGIVIACLALLGLLVLVAAIGRSDRGFQVSGSSDGFDKKVADAIAAGNSDAAIARAIKRNRDRRSAREAA